MSSMREVGKVTEIGSGNMKEILVDGREILLARIENKYYATDNRCPHMGGKLSQGKLEGTIVTCPKHGSQFDLADGHVVRWLKGTGLLSTLGKVLKSPKPLRMHTVKIEGDKILVAL